MKKYIIKMIAIAAMTGPALADDTVKSLMFKCENLATVDCHATVVGVAESFGKPPHACLPYSIEECLAQARAGCGFEEVKAFMKWARAHREQWDLSAAVGITEALRTAYPCEGRGQ